MRRIFLVTLVAVLVPYVSAQRTSFPSPRFAPSRGANSFASRGFHRGADSRAFYPLAYGDPFYADYLSSTGYPVASQPPVIFVQSPQSPAPEPQVSPSPAEPLVIELQGDHYVRLSGEDNSGTEMIHSESIRRPEKLSGTATPSPATEAPVVLIFRDGHREEVSEYTIAGGVLYAQLDYATDGSWNKKIELSSLNLTETTKTNQSHGVKFQIPHSPNEVIVRP